MMRLDLHCHSRYSYDSFLEPAEAVERALELGLDGICFTEHFSVEASRPIDDLDLPTGFVVLRGVEISTKGGHLLAYGLRDDSWNTWRRSLYLDLDQVIASIHRLGAICVPAHPFRERESLGDQLERTAGFDALETHNGRDEPELIELALAAAQRLALPTIGGSDAHTAGRVGTGFTVFEREIRTIDDLLTEIRAGRCRGETWRERDAL